MAPPVCQGCRDIFTDSSMLSKLQGFGAGVSGPHWSTSILEEKKGAECSLCKILYTAWMKHKGFFNTEVEEGFLLVMRESKNPLRKFVQRNTEYPHTHIENIQLMVYMGPDEGNKLHLIATLACSTEEDDPAARCTKLRLRDTFHMSDRNISYVRSQINNCIERFRGTKEFNYAPTPTRLLKLQIAKEAIEIQLVTTNRLANFPYAALSYCWGGPQTTLLTSLTKETMERGLSSSDLPQCLQDAIIITLQFNLSYLWIDALCIIQDSPEDKAFEIGNMINVYRHSYITISAASSANVDTGFLVKRTSEIAQLPFLCCDGRMGTVFLEDDAVPANPIESRAWTFQEKVLSTHIVTFGNNGVKWTCHGDHPGSDMAISSARASKETLQIEARAQWCRAVEEYSSRSLAYQEDKLPAISGIANKFQKEFPGDIYIAGLWKSELIDKLSWYSKAGISEKKPTIQDYYRNMPRALPLPSTGLEIPKNTRPEPPCAPSWSWAAIQGRVSWAFLNDNIYTGTGYCSPNGEDCRLIAWEAIPVTKSAPYGQVKPGSYLLLSGRVKHAKWHTNRQFLVDFDDGAFQPFERALPDTAEVLLLEEIWCLELPCNSALMLTKLEDGAFTRVGLCIRRSDISLDRDRKGLAVGDLGHLDSNKRNWFESARLETVKLY